MKLFCVLILFLFSSVLDAQICDPDSLIIIQTRARDTDALISWEANRHHSFYNPTCISKNTLVVHLVGSFDNPSSTILFPTVAANNGFDVVSLKYPNSTAAKTACNNSSDATCYSKFRREIIEGVDYSTEINVDVTNSLYNRLIKLLQYLDANNPSHNWGNYFVGNTILWNKIIVSGHSQGGGHAAIIAQDNNIKRVLMFASPNDYSTFFTSPANWTSQTNATADSLFYGFNNINDDVVDFSEQYTIWNNLGMPTFGDSIDVDVNQYPYNNSRQLYTKYDTTGLGGKHSVMILDSKTPIDINGNPLFEPVWKYMLGITSNPTVIQNNNKTGKLINIYPNPTHSKLSIQTNFKDVYQLDIYTVLGKLKKTYSNLNQPLINIDLQDFETGVYLIKITEVNNKTFNTKLFKR